MIAPRDVMYIDGAARPRAAVAPRGPWGGGSRGWPEHSIFQFATTEWARYEVP